MFRFVGRSAGLATGVSLFVVWGVLVVPAPASAASITGRVLDAVSGDPVAGVEIRLPEVLRVVVTRADGYFEFTDIAPGEVTLSLYRVGYQPAKRRTVAAAPGSELVIQLQPAEFREDPIVVSATRVQRRDSPVPYSNLSRRDLEERYTTQDIPVLLSELPSAVYYSESGNGLGYNYLTLRGFDQRRLSVLVFISFSNFSTLNSL